jgi:hypothetical protein
MKCTAEPHQLGVNIYFIVSSEESMLLKVVFDSEVNDYQ